jgi:hypothetical protein
MILSGYLVATPFMVYLVSGPNALWPSASPMSVGNYRRMAI